jgi:hypothetical protein
VAGEWLGDVYQCGWVMHRRRRQAAWTAYFLAAGACASASAQISVKVELDLPEALVNERITFDVVVRNVETAPQPKAPEIPGCVVQYLGRETFRSADLSRNPPVIDQGVRFHFSLVARNPGEIEIPPIPLTIKGREYRTEPVKVSILKSGSSNLAFAEVNCNADRLYIGQRVDCTLTLWVKPLRTSRGPLTVQQMWECISSPRQTQGPFKLGNAGTVRKSINGGPEESYYAFEWKASAVIESASALPGCDIPIELDYPRLGRDSIGFERLERGRHFEFTPECNLPTILPLPADGRPARFNGAVGTFQIETSAKPTQVRVGDPIELTIAISGDGVLDTVAPPELSTSPALAERFKVPEEALAGRLVGQRRVFTQIVRPRSADVREIPPIELPYFDPALGEYRIAKSESIPLTVSAGSQLSEVDVVGMSAPSGESVSAVPEIVDGLRGNVLSEDKLLASVRPVTMPALLFVTFAPPALFALVWGGTALLHNRNGNAALRRRNGALAAAQRRIDAATRLEAPGGSREIAAAVCGYVADRLNEPPARFTGRALVDALRQRGVSGDVLVDCERLIDGCDQAAYAGGSESTGEYAAAARACLARLERERL